MLRRRRGDPAGDVREGRRTAAGRGVHGTQAQCDPHRPRLLGLRFAWTVEAWGAPSSTCSAAATQTRTVACVRQDGKAAAENECAGESPNRERTIESTSTCSYAWEAGDWSPFAPTCSTSSTRGRAVSCRRSDGTTVGDASCTDTSPRPATGETAIATAGCVHAWSYGLWASDSTCSKSTTQRRTATCMRTIEGADVAVDASACAGLAREDVRTDTADNSSCVVGWKVGPWTPTPPVGTCTSSYAQTSTVSCQATYPDGSMAEVPDRRCNQAKKPPSSQTIAVTAGCPLPPAPA